MLVILSPSKKLDFNTKTNNNISLSEPFFKEKTEKLADILKKLSKTDIRNLMKLSDDLTNLNYQRFQEILTNKSAKKACIFAFKGNVYDGIDIESFNFKELTLANKKIKILSGLYGILKPFDQIQPYRLEMGTKLKNDQGNNLYDFWKEELTNYIKNSLKENNSKYLINLASNEYSKSIKLKELSCNVITPHFKDYKNGQYKIIMTYAKKARGLMTKYIIKNNIKTPEELKKFNLEGYKFSKEDSDELNFVFNR